MSTSYSVISVDDKSQPNLFMWTCTACDEIGTARHEGKTVEAMNDHMETEHPDHEYVAPPPPM